MKPKRQPKEHYVSPALLQRSRDLRHPLTPAEAKVWARVRNRQLGFKIRRQHPIGHFITDFACLETKLIIEIDGDTHAAPDQADYDAARTAWLEGRGWRVLRFSNDDAHQRLPAVLAAIQAACALPHIYLSPHLDDAVLSCGGMMAQQVRNGERVIVITVCAGDPPPGPLSSFAESLHQRWNTSANAVALRRAEDIAALRIVGAEVIHWEVPDCIYRAVNGEHLYASESALFGELHPAEAALAKSLAAQLAALGPARWYAPYTLGHHVDHQLVRRAAELSDAALAYYEDYPYAERETVSSAEPLAPQLIALTESDLAAKSRAIAEYRSQISSFWKGVPEMEAALRAFALKTGGGVLAERLWRLP